MKAVFSLLMSVAIALGGALPGRALHDCAMTGKRGQPACCCKAVNAGCPSCASCEPGAAPALERTGPSREAAVLRAVCCSITHEKSALRHATPPGPQGAWKASLEGGRLAAALPSWPDPVATESGCRAPRGPPPLSFSGAKAPLFILHCSLAL